MLQVKIKDDTGNTIGQNIRRVRKSRNIGQTALVRDLQLLDIDMTREALVKIERGIQHIQLSQLKGIRDVLQIDAADGADSHNAYFSRFHVNLQPPDL